MKITTDLIWESGAPAEIEVGMLLQLKTGKLILIGDLNDLGGMCDCCTRWGSDKQRESEILRRSRLTTKEILEDLGLNVLLQLGK